MNYSWANVFLKLIPAILILAGWQIFIWLRPDYEFFIGSPYGIVVEAKELLITGVLLIAIGITGLEAFLGFLCGSILGTLIGLLFWYFKWLKNVSQVYVSVLGSIPIFALGPVLVFWFGTGLFSKIILGFLSTLAIAISQAFNGASEADPNLQKLLIVFGASKRQIFTKLIVPSSIIWMLAGIRINIGLALLGAFIGEFIASRQGLGYLIIVAQGLYNVNQIWVGVIGIVGIAIFFYILTGPIERWARRWQEPNFSSG